MGGAAAFCINDISLPWLLRLYLINSPVVRAEFLKFQENGVRDVVKEVFLPWYNDYRFLIQNVQRLEAVSSPVFSTNSYHGDLVA